MPDTDDWQPVPNKTIPCRKCGAAGQIEYREWESSCGGYEDYHYRCGACGNDWWIEGADA